VEALPEVPSDETLHEIRIKGKRARYAAELVQAIVGKPAERFIAKVKELQDVLGEHQDALVMGAVAPAPAPSPGQSRSKHIGPPDELTKPPISAWDIEGIRRLRIA